MRRIIVATLAVVLSQGVGGALAFGAPAQGMSTPPAGAVGHPRASASPNMAVSASRAAAVTASPTAAVSASPTAAGASARGGVAGPSASRPSVAPAGLPMAVVDARAGAASSRGAPGRAESVGSGGGDPLDPDAVDPFHRRGRKDAHDSPVVAILVPIAFFLTVLGIVLLSLLMGFRKERLRHETLRLMVERGAEIPVALLTGPAKRRSSDLRKGAIWTATGLGTSAALAVLTQGQAGHPWAIGLVPTLVGLGYLLVWRLEGRQDASAEPGQDALSSAPGVRGPAEASARQGDAEHRPDPTFPSA